MGVQGARRCARCPSRLLRPQFLAQRLRSDRPAVGEQQADQQQPLPAPTRIEYRARDETSAAVGILQQFVPNATDGWTWTLRELTRLPTTDPGGEMAPEARSSLDAARRYSMERVQFDRPIAGFQLTQAKLAAMATELQLGQLLALHLGRRKDTVGLRPEQVSVGKYNNVTKALEICRTARTILGANGVSGEWPVMRHANNLESVLTYEGTVEMHTLVIGQALTGESAFR